MSNKQVDKVKRGEDGKIYVKWQGDQKWYVIDDPLIAQYFIFNIVAG